ncbi:MAG: cellulase family glycosylhydrolase [Steroidobacteraceae bacterium]
MVQLRGANLMGMEYTAVGGWSPSNPFPQLVESNWAALKSWGINVVRIPLNQSSWFNTSCVNGSSVMDPDPGDNYKTKLKSVVDRATSEGLYVILDLHWSAPRDTLSTVSGISAQCAMDQNVMADADGSIQFWSEVATIYKSYPNVMFELYNEPYLTQWTLTGTEAQAWMALRDGATIDSYVPRYATGRLWQSAGYQAMLDAVRNTGATNIVLTSGMDWAGQLQYWYTYRPNDPINQLAAAWHAYHTYGATWGSQSYTLPKWGESAYTWAQNILDSNIPVIVTEYGDQNTTGTVGAPFASALLPRLDTMGISYLGWTFTAAGLTDNQLIKDNNGTPTDGYGTYVKAHYLCRAAGTTSCP